MWVRFSGSQNVKEKEYLDAVIIWKVSSHRSPKGLKIKFDSHRSGGGARGVSFVSKKPMKLWYVVTVYSEKAHRTSNYFLKHIDMVVKDQQTVSTFYFILVLLPSAT